MKSMIFESRVLKREYFDAREKTVQEDGNNFLIN
jgi:hypothetical protein